MPLVETRRPRPGELWLSRPPYLLIAHILSLDLVNGRRVVTYELADEDGSILEQVDHALLDAGWWQAFQPLTRRFG